MRIIGNAGKAREVQAVASGVLPNGKPVVVNADGTVSVISATGGGAATGTPVIYEAADTQTIAATFDSNSNKVVIVYMDNGNSSLCTAIVGTVSGTSISFGTPATFGVVAQATSATFDSNSNKVVIVYRDTGNNYGTAVVATVSGTSISFGTPSVFESAYTEDPNAAFDSINNKVIIAYRDSGNSDFGTAVVATVSGTSISFGTPVVFETASSYTAKIAFDTNAQKAVIAYRDGGNSNYGTAIVGTVSGTSISFGTPSVFESVSVDSFSIAYDANAAKVVIAYQRYGSSQYGTATVGTVSGTGISFGTPVVFESAVTDNMSISYDSNAEKVIIAYKDNGNSGYGTAIVGTVSGTSISFGSPIIYEQGAAELNISVYDSNTNSVVIAYKDNSNSNQGTAVVFKTASTNLTSDNYIGTAATGAPSGQGARINIKGAVDESQSGLTAGQSYYVQADGTLGTTPADPSVFAGTAVAATKLIVKG